MAPCPQGREASAILLARQGLLWQLGTRWFTLFGGSGRMDGWTCSPRGESWCFILLRAAPPSAGL